MKKASRQEPQEAQPLAALRAGVRLIGRAAGFLAIALDMLDGAAHLSAARPEIAEAQEHILKAVRALRKGVGRKPKTRGKS